MFLMFSLMDDCTNIIRVAFIQVIGIKTTIDSFGIIISELIVKVFGFLITN